MKRSRVALPTGDTRGDAAAVVFLLPPPSLPRRRLSGRWQSRAAAGMVAAGLRLSARSAARGAVRAATVANRPDPHPPGRIRRGGAWWRGGVVAVATGGAWWRRTGPAAAETPAQIRAVLAGSGGADAGRRRAAGKQACWRRGRGGGGAAELAAVAAPRSSRATSAAATARDHGATAAVETARIPWRWWQQRLVGGDSTVAGRRHWRLLAAVALGLSRRRQRRGTRGDGCGSSWTTAMGLRLAGGELPGAATAAERGKGRRLTDGGGGDSGARRGDARHGTRRGAAAPGRQRGGTRAAAQWHESGGAVEREEGRRREMEWGKTIQTEVNSHRALIGIHNVLPNQMFMITGIVITFVTIQIVMNQLMPRRRMDNIMAWTLRGWTL
uniref:Uncharacterized protein n=1 Tax=Oryza rufipogon TaxID=4529 RepID=A0A0E0N0I3_ORYRU